jgi:hypothetical protein
VIAGGSGYNLAEFWSRLSKSLKLTQHPAKFERPGYLLIFHFQQQIITQYFVKGGSTYQSGPIEKG